MNLKKINFLIFFLFFLFILTGCGKDKDVTNVNTNTGNIVNNQSNLDSIVTDKKVIDYINVVGGDINNLSNDFGGLTSTGNLEDLKLSINSEDFQKIQIVVDRIVGDVSNNTDLTKDDKIKIQALKYVKVMAVLNEGNYFYTEKEKSEEAVKIIENILVEYPYSVNDFLNNYYLGYSKEIVKNYTGALDNYNTGLSKLDDFDKDGKYKSILTNQIGHVYDLKGDKDKAYKYYTDAYTMYNKNYRASLNIARYLTRIGKIEDSKKFYIYSLGTVSKYLQSEILYSLSSIELELNGLTPDIDKSIENAKKALELNKNNAMGYLALARGYYMLNNSKYDNEITQNLDTSIKLNPNGNEAYRYYALYYLDKKNLIKAQSYLDKSKEVVDKDMILMEDQRISFNYLNDLYKIFVGISINKLDDVYDFYNKEELKYIIKTQLKRKNNGIYSSLSNSTKFVKVIEYFK